jgi:hypothetical protein
VRRVRETWTAQVALKIVDGKSLPHVGVFVSDKFHLDDVVRVTVEKLPPRKGRKGQ